MKNNQIQLDLSIDELNIVLEALGAMPFARVYALIGRIQEGARQQIEEANAAAAAAAAAAGANGNGSDRKHAG